jgi:hypothetical protein
MGDIFHFMQILLSYSAKNPAITKDATAEMQLASKNKETSHKASKKSIKATEEDSSEF